MIDADNLPSRGIKGTLVKSLIKTNENAKEVFETYVSKDKYADLYAKHWLEDTSRDFDDNMPVHEFVSMFTKRELLQKSSKMNKARHSLKLQDKELENLVPVLRQSSNSPHAYQGKRTRVEKYFIFHFSIIVHFP